MTKNGSRVRLGVDIGGTFTDVVLEVNKTLFSRKVLTTFLNPEDGILDGINQVCGLAKVAPQHIQQVIHGTTLATNALIERTGAKTALITTKGFRDVIEMRTESRFEQYDLNLKLPEPLIPRQQRYVVEERLNASGEILIPLKYKDVEKLVEKLKDAKFESIAVGLIHSYRNSCHEEMLFRIITEKMPNIMVSLSSKVSPQMREYERFNTVAANAYIKPLIKNYLLRLEKRLIQKGIKCSVFLMHSGGGIMSLNDAAEYPVRLIESGPAGGAVLRGGRRLCFSLRGQLHHHPTAGLGCQRARRQWSAARRAASPAGQRHALPAGHLPGPAPDRPHHTRGRHARYRCHRQYSRSHRAAPDRCHREHQGNQTVGGTEDPAVRCPSRFSAPRMCRRPAPQ